MGRILNLPISLPSRMTGDVVACALAPFTTGVLIRTSVDTSPLLGLVMLALSFSMITPIWPWYNTIQSTPQNHHCNNEDASGGSLQELVDGQ